MTSSPSSGAHLVPGAVLAGKYCVERVLGVGGMGVVVAARHLQLDTKVAIKFLLPTTLANREIVARFAREARAAVRVANEHVARVFDVGTLEDGAPYMVMEFLDGEDLAAWLQSKGPLPVEQAIEFLLQACVAVADAHALGIVHRDLKPANLFCVRRSDGRHLVKVLDFGISKLADAVGSSGAMTSTTALMGSPLYMSPEQMASAKNVDAQTDIWALGVIAYELLSGRTPFSGETITEVVVQVTTRSPAPLQPVRPDVPAGLEAAILRCLERDRARRYGDVGALARDLLPFAAKGAHVYAERIAGIVASAGIAQPGTQQPALAATVPVSGPVGRSAPIQTNASLGRTTAGVGRRSVGAWSVAVGAVLLAGIVVGWRLLSGAHTGQTPGFSGTAVMNADPARPEEPQLRGPRVPSATAPAAIPTVEAAPEASTGQAVQPSTADAGKAAPRRDPGTTHPSPRVVATVAAPPAATSPAPNCNPPYTVDAQGNHVFKKECVN